MHVGLHHAQLVTYGGDVLGQLGQQIALGLRAAQTALVGTCRITPSENWAVSNGRMHELDERPDAREERSTRSTMFASLTTTLTRTKRSGPKIGGFQQLIAFIGGEPVVSLAEVGRGPSPRGRARADSHATPVVYMDKSVTAASAQSTARAINAMDGQEGT